MNLGFDIINSIGRFDVQRDGFTGEGFDENLMRSTKRTVKRGERTKGGKDREIQTGKPVERSDKERERERGKQTFNAAHDTTIALIVREEYILRSPYY